MKVNDENSRIRIQDPDPDPLVRGMVCMDPDPDLPQNGMDPQHCFISLGPDQHSKKCPDLEHA